MQIKCTRVRKDEPFAVPTKSYDKDAGLDFYVSTDTIIRGGGFERVHTNVAIEIPTGYWGLITARSSVFIKRRLISHTGVIDSGYRGEVTGLITNPTNLTVSIRGGERIFQLIILQSTMVSLIPVSELMDSHRSTRGMGSSGK